MKTSNSNKRIMTLLNELNISKTDFCKATGLNKSALSNYLNGDRTPRQDQLDKIANTYNINPAWLMGYDVPMHEENNKHGSIDKDNILDTGDRKEALAIEQAKKLYEYYQNASPSVQKAVDLLLKGDKQ